MDVDDVSGRERFVALLGKQKQTLEAAKTRKGERPKDTKSRDLLIQDFMVDRVRQKSKALFWIYSPFYSPLLHSTPQTSTITRMFVPIIVQYSRNISLNTVHYSNDCPEHCPNIAHAESEMCQCEALFWIYSPFYSPLLHSTPAKSSMN